MNNPKRAHVLPIVSLTPDVWRYMTKFLCGRGEARLRAVCIAWNQNSQGSTRVTEFQQLFAAIPQLPLRLSPWQTQMFIVWMDGIQSGGGMFADFRRWGKQGGYSTAIALFCMALSSVDVSARWRLHVIRQPDQSAVGSFYSRVACLCAMSMATGNFSVNYPMSTVLTMTHYSRKREIAISHQHRMVFSAGDYVIYDYARN